MKPKATASPRGGVESSRRRTDGLQDDEPDSAGEAASLRLGGEAWVIRPTGRAEATGKATIRAHHVVGGGTSGRQSRVSRETCRAGEARQESEPA